MPLPIGERSAGYRWPGICVVHQGTMTLMSETLLLPVVGLNLSRPWEVGRVRFHPAGAAAGLIEAARSGPQRPAALQAEQ
jgi:hypothetical protein